MKNSCVFCKIVSGKVPAEVIWKDDKHIAFLSIFPNTEGFSVVAVKEHKPSDAFKNDDKTLTDLVLATKHVANLLTKAFDDVARTGMFLEGYGVDHLHSKLFPMHGTAGTDKWEKIEASRDEYYEKYPGYLSSHDSKKAEQEELKKVADKIRKVR